MGKRYSTREIAERFAARAIAREIAEHPHGCAADNGKPRVIDGRACASATNDRTAGVCIAAGEPRPDGPWHPFRSSQAATRRTRLRTMYAQARASLAVEDLFGDE